MSHVRLLMAMLIFAAAAVGLSLLLDQLLWLYGDIFAKIMFRQDLGFLSVTQRLEALERSLSYLAESPIIGIGLGTLSTRGEGSSINWYLFVATEACVNAAVSCEVSRFS